MHIRLFFFFKFVAPLHIFTSRTVAPRPILKSTFLPTITFHLSTQRSKLCTNTNSSEVTTNPHLSVSTVNACSTRRTAPGSRGSRDRPTIWQLIDRASGEGRHVSLRPLGDFPEMHLHSVLLSFFTVESQFTVRWGKQNDSGWLYISTVLYQMMKSCNWWTLYDAKMSPGTWPQSSLTRHVPTFRIFCESYHQVGSTNIMKTACIHRSILFN